MINPHDLQSREELFSARESYWNKLFDQIVGSSTNEWVANFPADIDGNPILTRINRSMKPSRALRIIQKFNTDKLVEFDLENPQPLYFKNDAYVAFVPDLTNGALDSDGVTTIEELVIFSDVTDVCERLNKDFITKWCVEKIAENDMKQKLNTFWTPVRENLIEQP